MSWKKFYPLGLCVLLLGAKYCLEEKITKGSRTPSSINPTLASYQSQSLKTFALGFDHLISSFLWVDLLQNARHTPIEREEVSWEYAQTDAITTLDPKFERAYSFGATFLSVFRRDRLGGKALLEKWVKQNPRAWRPTYLLGIHYYLEMQDYNHAAPLILKASLMPGAPQWISSVGIRLLSHEGALLSAMKAAIEIYPAIYEREAQSRLEFRIRSLNWNLQKQNYVQALEDFRQKFRREPASTEELRPYLMQAERKLSSLLESEEMEDAITVMLHEKFEFYYSNESKSIEGKNKSLQALLEKVGIYVNSTSPKKEEK